MKTATSTKKAAPKRRRARSTAAEATPEPLDDSLEADLLAEPELDPDALEEVAALEAAALDTGEPGDGDGADDDIVDDAADADGAVVAGTEPDEEEDEPGLGVLLTGMLVPDRETADDDDERDVSGLEIEFVPTARGNEFVCSACFLIWNRRHLADPERKVCRDCIDDVATAAA